jgi:hypothetical protein
MSEIAFTLSYAEFDDIKGCDSANKMWDALHTIYGGDANVLRAKYESLRGNLYDMRMQEGENVARYCSILKDVVNIRGDTSKIDDDTISRKVLRTFFPIYAIRVSIIQELRCIPSSNPTLEGLVGRIATFEPSNLDKFKYDNVQFSSKAKFSLKEPNEKKKKEVKYVSNDSDIDEEDVEHLEALLARIFHKGKGKFKGKLPIMCFNCNEVGHISIKF